VLLNRIAISSFCSTVTYDTTFSLRVSSMYLGFATKRHKHSLFIDFIVHIATARFTIRFHFIYTLYVYVLVFVYKFFVHKQHRSYCVLCTSVAKPTTLLTCDRAGCATLVASLVFDMPLLRGRPKVRMTSKNAY